MQLSPGAVTETVEVSAYAAVLKTDRADVTTTIRRWRWTTCQSA